LQKSVTVFCCHYCSLVWFIMPTVHRLWLF